MRACLALVALVACASAVSAARVHSESLTIGNSWMPNAGNIQRWYQEAGKKGDDEPAYVAFRYFVEPDNRKDFIDAWLKLEKETTKEEDVIIFDLKKPVSDNVEFIGYGEWKSFK
eukprot:GHRR01025609.1.p2 GENE.GHRR01025609.1~~GHRR01025609.1.p2  ORF type:complete len:115 (-),score=23.24 GHRR01025609.1:515-859(-)